MNFGGCDNVFDVNISSKNVGLSLDHMVQKFWHLYCLIELQTTVIRYVQNKY